MTERSEDWKNMISGEPFNSLASDLMSQRELIRQRTAQFNRAPSKGHLKELFKQFHSVGLNCIVEGGIHIDYGSQLEFGNNIYINAHCVFLDAAKIKIADHVLVGPNVQFYTVNHSSNPIERKNGICFAKPIHIEANVWIGGGVTILPGITVGENAIIAAGSVVTKDVLANTTVRGNPAIKVDY